MKLPNQTSGINSINQFQDTFFEGIIPHQLRSYFSGFQRPMIFIPNPSQPNRLVIDPNILPDLSCNDDCECVGTGRWNDWVKSNCLSSITLRGEEHGIGCCS